LGRQLPCARTFIRRKYKEAARRLQRNPQAGIRKKLGRSYGSRNVISWLLKSSFTRRLSIADHTGALDIVAFTDRKVVIIASLPSFA